MPTYSEEILRLAEAKPLEILAGSKFAEMANRLCGDRIRIALEIDRDKIDSVRWHCEGCAILRASAAYLARALTHKTTGDAVKFIREFSASFDRESPARANPLSAVYNLPARYKCALLPFEAAENFLRDFKR